MDRPEEVIGLHQQFVDAGADIILTNTFGCNPHRLKLHKAEDAHVRARQGGRRTGAHGGRCRRRGRSWWPVPSGPPASCSSRSARSPTTPLWPSFSEEIRGLKAGGADVVWIETMSSAEEVHAAATAAIANDMPYVATCSFDTAGRTMMGVMPNQLSRDPRRRARGAARAGRELRRRRTRHPRHRARDAGRHRAAREQGQLRCAALRQGTEIVYTGTPELMARYAALAIDAGAQIVGGCCGTTPEHLAAMRAAHRRPRQGRPADASSQIVESVGELTNSAPTANSGERRSRRSRGE